MESHDDTYREMPRTGRAPEYSEHELETEIVDPSVLTDDREDSDLLVFEKTWGHRLLAGLGVAMIVISIVLSAYIIVQIVRIYDYVMLLPELYSVYLYVYITFLVATLALILPACVAIYVAKHPKKVRIAIALAGFALLLIVAFFVCLIVLRPSLWITALLYSLLLLILPVIYLIAALKIQRSQ